MSQQIQKAVKDWEAIDGAMAFHVLRHRVYDWIDDGFNIHGRDGSKVGELCSSMCLDWPLNKLYVAYRDTKRRSSSNWPNTAPPRVRTIFVAPVQYSSTLLIRDTIYSSILGLVLS